MIKFMCTRDYVMDDGDIAFKKGKFYTFTREEDMFWGEDEQGDMHLMSLYADMWNCFLPEKESCLQ